MPGKIRMFRAYQLNIFIDKPGNISGRHPAALPLYDSIKQRGFRNYDWMVKLKIFFLVLCRFSSD